jgi:hypothetical protein
MLSGVYSTMKTITAALAIALLTTGYASAQTTPAKARTDPQTLRLFKGQNFTGESYLVEKARPSLQLEMSVGSMAIHPGEKWEVCDKPRFKGNCNIIDADMNNMGEVAIQSARPVK